MEHSILVVEDDEMLEQQELADAKALREGGEYDVVGATG